MRSTVPFALQHISLLVWESEAVLLGIHYDCYKCRSPMGFLSSDRGACTSSHIQSLARKLWNLVPSIAKAIGP